MDETRVSISGRQKGYRAIVVRFAGSGRGLETALEPFCLFFFACFCLACRFNSLALGALSCHGLSYGFCRMFLGVLKLLVVLRSCIFLR